MVHREGRDGAGPLVRASACSGLNIPTYQHSIWSLANRVGVWFDNGVGASKTGPQNETQARRGREIYACGTRYFRLRHRRDAPWRATRMHLSESADRQLG